MVHGALDQLVAVEVVDARVAGVDPMALPGGIDEEGRQRAVRLLLGGDGRELDDDVGFLHHLLEHGRRIVVSGEYRSNSCLAVSMTWSDALRPPLRPPMPSATMPSTHPLTRGWLISATWSCWYSRSPLWMPVDAVSR